MSVIWALRSDNAAFNARYAPNGKTAADMGAPAFGGLSVYEGDVTAIGNNRINMDNGFANVARGLCYPGRNTFSNQAFSVLMRIQLPLRQTVGLLELSLGPTTDINRLILYTVATGSGTDFRINLNNQIKVIIAAAGVLYGTDPAFDTWLDLVFTFTGNSGTNQIKMFINATEVGSITASAAASNPRDPNLTGQICIGGVQNLLQARMKVNEVVMWDEVINPASVGLVGGTGSLNGASRTAFVDVAEFDGTNNTWPTEAQVEEDVDYIQNGVPKTGTLSLACDYPAEDVVKYPTVYANGALTGTLGTPAPEDGNWAPTETQKKLYEVLSTDSILVGLLGSTVGGAQKIFDFIPDNQAFPYVKMQFDPWTTRDNETWRGWECQFTIETWYQGPGRGKLPVQQIQKRIDEIIHHTQPCIEGWNIVALALLECSIEPEIDMVTLKGVQRFKLLIGEKTA